MPTSLVCVLNEPIKTRAGLPPGIVRDLTRRVFNIRYSTSIPGGFQSCTLSMMLSRSEAYDWYERFLFWGITIYEADEIMWQGRISDIQIKEYGVDITCEGYWASLADATLYSFWADNDMGKWIVPTPGAGSLPGEITLAGIDFIDKYNISVGGDSLHIGLVKGNTYNSGDRAAIYYRLPRVSNLTRRGVFAPMTIQSIQFEYDFRGVGGGGAAWTGGGGGGVWWFRLYTADHALGTWTKRTDIDDLGVTPSFAGSYVINLVGPGTDTEAVAFVVEQTSGSTTISAETDTDSINIRRVVVFADHDPTTTNKLLPKKIITGLLNGDNDLGASGSGIRGIHAEQVAADTSLIEDSSTEIIPAVFEAMTMQDIIAQVAGYGFAQEVNLFENPSAENNLDGFVVSGGGSIAQSSLFARYGTDSVRATGSVGVTNRVTFRKTNGTSRMDVLAGEYYTISAFMKVDPAGSSVTVRFEIGWYNSGGTLLQTDVAQDDITVVDGDDWQRPSWTAQAPEGATTAEPYIEEVIGWDTTDHLHIDGVQFERGLAPSDYIDGDQPLGTWSGTAHASKSHRVFPVTAGVFGRNRLKVQTRRLDRIKRYFVSMREMGPEAIVLQRSIQEFWTRHWARFQEAYTGLTKFSAAQENIAEQNLIYAERDKVTEIGEVTENFAEIVTGVLKQDNRLPKQQTEITIKGFIRNAIGATVPVWRVRSGEAIFIEDLSPMARIPANLDSLRLFMIKETEFDSSDGSCRMVLDMPPPYLDVILSGVGIVPSLGGNVTFGSVSGKKKTFPTIFPGAGPR
jgi:hypothetical protein